MEKTAFGLHLLMLTQKFAPLNIQLPTPLQAIELDGVTAIGRWFNTSDLQAFESMSDNLEWLSKQAIAHDQIIKQAATFGAVLPFKLGAFFSSEESLRATVAENRETYKMQLRALEGKQEWSVKLYGNHQNLASSREIEKELASIQQLIDQASPGKAFLLRKKAEQHRMRASLRSAEESISAFCSELQEQVLKLEMKGAINKKLTEREEDMLLNTAVLVDEEGLPQWKSWLEQQQQHWQEKNIELAVSGPWPPYHFTQNAMV